MVRTMVRARRARSRQGPETRTVTNRFGTFQVPATPTRLLVFEGRRDLEVALALGLSPIAIGQNALRDGKVAPFIDFDPTGLDVVNPNEPNLEQILRIRPDLIMGRAAQLV